MQGRPSIDPEVFVRMILLEALYNIDSDRQLCEEVGYNMVYRWFCMLSLKDNIPRGNTRSGKTFFEELAQGFKFD